MKFFYCFTMRYITGYLQCLQLGLLCYSVVVAQGCYGLWSCFGWSYSMFEMALKNLETSTVFMWYSIMRGKGRFCSTVGRSLESSLHSIMRCFLRDKYKVVWVPFPFYRGTSGSSRGLLAVV